MANDESIGRDIHCPPSSTIENCHAIRFTLDAGEAQPMEMIVWRNRKSILKPVDKKSIRDIRSGDLVFVGETRLRVIAVDLYR